MMKYVHIPVLEKDVFPLTDPAPTPAYQRLVTAYLDMDLLEDPYVIELMENPTEQNKISLRKIFLNRRTDCQTVMKGLCTRSEVIGRELGAWARDYYVREAIRRFKKTISDNLYQYIEWNDREKMYLLDIFSKLEVPDSKDMDPSLIPANLSEKVNHLIGILLREYNSQLQEDNSQFSCIVFVEQRVVVVLLSLILSLHPRTKDLFRPAPFVGTSSSSKRNTAGVSDLVEIKLQKDTIADLREGRKNVIFATSVLEEGIDISSCHVVICFDEAANLKSFIQRRGRARKARSKFIMMRSEDNPKEKEKTWQELEQEMVKLYQDDMRQLEKLKYHDDEEEEKGRLYKIESTRYF
jgi:ERCC4-related helicase